MKKRPRIQREIRNPLDIVKSRIAKLTQAELDEQRLALQPAVDRLCAGNWEQNDWGAVRDAANRTEILMRYYRVADPTMLLEVGAVISAARDRHHTKGTKALYPREVEVDREVTKILAARRNREAAASNAPDFNHKEPAP